MSGLLAFFVLLFQAFNDGRVNQGGGIAENCALPNIAQESPHDLAATGLGQIGALLLSQQIITSARGDRRLTCPLSHFG